MKKIVVVGSVAAIALSLAMLVSASGAVAKGLGGAPRVTTLSGAEEVPPRATEGSGTALITLNVGQGRVCWELSWDSLTGAPRAAHIHRAPQGANGPVVVALSVAATASGSSSDCLEGVDPALVQEIIDYPERFYVNIHTPTHPGGEIRGQLSNIGQSR